MPSDDVAKCTQMKRKLILAKYLRYLQNRKKLKNRRKIWSPAVCSRGEEIYHTLLLYVKIEWVHILWNRIKILLFRFFNQVVVIKIRLHVISHKYTKFNLPRGFLWLENWRQECKPFLYAALEMHITGWIKKLQT